MPRRAKKKRLSDSYRFPFFKPSVTVSGLFGDSHARVIRLSRRSKKQSAAPADWSAAGGTIADQNTFVTCRAVGLGSILSSICTVRIAGAVRA